MQVSLTLNRWNHAVNRLEKRLAEYSSEIQRLFACRSEHVNKNSKIRLNDNQEAISKLFTQCNDISDNIIVIRVAIMTVNVRLGISTEIIRQRNLMRSAKLFDVLKVLVKQSHTDALTIDEANAEIATIADADSRYITVTQFDKEFLAKVLDETESLHLDVNKSADTISDLNKERIELNISEESARYIGATA